MRQQVDVYKSSALNVPIYKGSNAEDFVYLEAEYYQSHAANPEYMR